MRTISLVIMAVLYAAIAPSAWSQKGQGQGQGHGNQGHGQGNVGSSDGRGGPSSQDTRGGSGYQGSGAQGSFVIADRDRFTVSSYYRDEFARGNCPPGLAKKNNGCLPPGQAQKAWMVDQPLPPAIVYYPLPQPLYSRLTPPPLGYQYVRVYDDVLLMQSANRSVVSLVVNLR